MVEITPAKPKQKGVTAEEMAEIWACDVSTVQAEAKKGVAVRLGRNRFDFDMSTRNYIIKLRATASGHKSEGEDVVAEGAKLKRAQRNLVEMRIEQARGNLIDKAAALDLWGGIIRQVRALVMQWPRRAQSELAHLTNEDVAVLKQMTVDLLSDAGAGKLLTEDPPLPQVSLNDPVDS